MLLALQGHYLLFYRHRQLKPACSMVAFGRPSLELYVNAGSGSSGPREALHTGSRCRCWFLCHPCACGHLEVCSSRCASDMLDFSSQSATGTAVLLFDAEPRLSFCLPGGPIVLAHRSAGPALCGLNRACCAVHAGEAKCRKRKDWRKRLLEQLPPSPPVLRASDGGIWGWLHAEHVWAGGRLHAQVSSADLVANVPLPASRTLQPEQVL